MLTQSEHIYDVYVVIAVNTSNIPRQFTNTNIYPQNSFGDINTILSIVSTGIGCLLIMGVYKIVRLRNKQTMRKRVLSIQSPIHVWAVKREIDETPKPTERREFLPMPVRTD